MAAAAAVIPACGGSILGSAASFAVLGASTVTNTAQQSVTLNNSATDSCGSIIALTGAVTMDTNTVTAGCSSSPATSTPQPGTWGLVGVGCLAGTLVLRKFRF
jgi:hypothetical protein